MLDRNEGVVKCYGCGQSYQVLGSLDMRSDESRKHCMHTGDTGLPRETLLNWINELQDERDDWLSTAFGVEG